MLSRFMLVLFFLFSWQLSASSYNPLEKKQDKISSDFYTLPSVVASILPPVEVFSVPARNWVKHSGDKFNLQRGNSWFAIDVVNNHQQATSFTLLVDGSLYVIDNQLFIKYKNSATSLLKGNNEVNNIFTSKITLQPHQSARLFLQIKSNGNAFIPIKVLTNGELPSYLSSRFLFSGLAIGGMAILALMILVNYIAMHNHTLLLLSGYFSIQALTLSVLHGITLYSFFPEFPELQGVELPLLFAMSAIFLLWFSSELFKLQFLSRKLHFIFKLVGWLLLVFLPISMLLTVEVSIHIAHFLNGLVHLLLIVLGVFLIKNSQRLAILFTAIISIQCAFKVMNISFNGWYEYNSDLFSIAFWLNGFLITYLLSRQYSDQIKEKHVAQQEALENAMISRNTQEELLTLQNDNQEQLELRVQERTLELNIALQELEEANRELEQKNTLDELTGLFNRRFYDQKIMAEFRRSRRNLTPLSLIIIDIDHFKAVNDTYGHLAGDKCLVKLAEIMKKCLRRSTDAGCRYGGEEFCFILPETDSKGALALAEELRQAVLSEAFLIESKDIGLSISCGVSTYQQEKNTLPEHLFSAADKALYQAKHQGRDQVKIAEITE